MSKSEVNESISIAEEAPADATLREQIAHEIQVLPFDWMGPHQTVARAAIKAFIFDNTADMKNVVQQFINPDFDDKWCAFKELYPIIDAWMIGAMEAADREPRYASLVKALIGSTCFTADLMDGRVDTWQRMLEICEDRLNAIAERGEREIFEPNKFSERIGDLGSEYFGVPVRMDNLSEMLPKDLWYDLIDMMASLGEDIGYDHEHACIYVVQFLTFAADARFQAAMAEISKESGGETRAAPPKFLTRMMGKMETDHKDEKFPKACCNIDCVRTGITFDDVDGLRSGFSIATSRYRPLRVKNTFRRDFDAAKKTFGYRCILLNLLYSEEGVTWGDVLDDVDDDVMRRYFIDSGCPEKDYPTDARPKYEALKMHERFRNAPFTYVGEIQFLHREYLKMRKNSHFWYKIHRAKELDGGHPLRLDFFKYNPTETFDYL